MPHRHDCNVNLLYDTSRRVWTAYVRPYAFGSGLWPQAGAHHRRRIAIAESADLIHWSKLRTVLGPEEGDENEFDNISVFPYEDVLVGLIGIFAEEPGHLAGQRMHVELAFSSDGRTWERVPGKPHFLSPTERAGDFDRDSVYGSTAALIDEERGEILIYYNGAAWEEGDARNSTAAVGLARLPADRFVEQYAGPEGGWLLTKEFLLEGDALEVNCRAAGFVRVELAEYPGNGIAGFSLEECDPITGDHRAWPVSWRGGQRDLSALRGRAVYLRFYLKEAGVYSLCATAGSA
jgi:hypothetical protein